MDTRQAEVMARAKAAVAALARDVDVVVAFVFGSQVDGKPDEHSDIDIAAFAHGVSSWGLMEHAQVMSRVQAELGDDIDLHIFSVDQLDQAGPGSLIAHVKQQGIPIEVSLAGRVAEPGRDYSSDDAKSGPGR